MASGTETAMALERPVPVTVLIVDDEDATRHLCRDVVAESGLRTRLASTTEQALEILEQFPVDIVLTDIRVQQLGGLELLKRIRETYPQTAESGTGKELVARSIHFSGSRRNRPFVPVDCSALVPTLIESELFGYVKGAFTGAVQSRQGLMEAAGAGTLFLDEIGELPTDLQSKLLRALQEKEVRPVGSTDRIAISTRIIAATNRDLEGAVRQGHFRQDLFFRLNVVQIKMPPLRERKTDIPLIVNSFLEKFSEPDGRPRTISQDAMARLIAYDWPGNVRELENAIERAVALGSGPILHVGDLPSNLHYNSGERMPQNDEIVPLDELERRAIMRALHESGGDKLAAARLLGIGKTTLYRKLKQYGSQAQPQEI